MGVLLFFPQKMEVSNENGTIVKFMDTFVLNGDECRLCLKKTNEVWQLFEINDELPRKIMACAHVQIDEADGLPTIICLSCRQLLDVSYNFKCQVEKSDAKLRHLYNLKTTSIIDGYDTAAEGVNDSLTQSVNQMITEAIADEMKIHGNDSTTDNLKNCVELTQLSTSVTSINNIKNANCVVMINRLNDDNNDNNQQEAVLFDVGINHNNKNHHHHNIDEMVAEKRDESNENEQRIPDISRAITPTNNVSVEKFKQFQVVKVETCILPAEESELSDDDDSEVYHDDEMFIENEEKVDVMETIDEEMDEKKTIDVEEAEENESDGEKSLSSRTSRHKCLHCMKTFALKSALQRHTAIHSNNKKTKLRYVCYMCDKQFATVHKLKNHVLTTHDSLKNDETNNDEVNSSDNDNEKSVEKIDENNSLIDEISEKIDKKNVKFSCKYCPKQFTYEKPFLTHAKRHPEYKNHQIKSMKMDEELKTRNVERVYESEDDDMPLEGLQCTQCGKLFATKRNLTRHLSTHTGLKFNCTTCNKEFSRLDKLKEHEQIKHKNEFFGQSDDDDDDDSGNEIKANGSDSPRKDKHNRPHKCPLCPKAFAQAQSLTNHMERHKRVKDTQKRFLCEVCSKCFAQSGSLVAHMRTHTGIKPYVCNVCSRAFTKSTYLQLHLRTHSGEKPYICQYCSRAFARANTLARHITMHTGEAKYHCQICMKSFRRLTSLNEHTYTHTGQRPYACKICTKRYNNAGSLYAHTKKCKVQQLTGNTNNTTFDNVTTDGNVNNQNGGVQTSAMMIYSQRKVVNDATNVESIVDNQSTATSPPSFIITNNIHDQKSPLATNIIQQYTVEEPNVYAVNAKQFKNPYYTIYPGM